MPLKDPWGEQFLSTLVANKDSVGSISKPLNLHIQYNRRMGACLMWDNFKQGPNRETRMLHNLKVHLSARKTSQGSAEV